MEEAPSAEFPMSLADRSDIQYRADRFPADGGLARLVERILQEEGVPTELAALPWIESSYQVGCYSSMGAAGPWQIIRETGRLFDLRIDQEVDERYSWVASTRAAARYLSYLHGLFDSWSLALAAYNCGEGAVLRAVSRGPGGAVETLDLPGETRAFVPRFASALRAYRQVDMSGDDLAVIWVPSGLDLRVLAASSGIRADSLLGLNRAYLRERTPSYGEGWEVIVPAGSASAAYTAAWSLDGGSYVVLEGDTWESIASALGVATDALVAANPSRALVAGDRLTLPEPASTPVNVACGETAGYFYYTVRSGDTLGGIGQTVGASSREVAEWNDMSRDDTIYPGQRLLLRGTPPGGGSAVVGAAPPPATDPSGATLTHTVTAGDTLWDLSARYGVSVEDLMSLNSLSGSNLSIGQVLVVRAGE